ncbi:MAG TPA: very short patch repair endonuclease [Bryobacteraceae bacterium]|nr:very short patch repair endonuclease [Bryobacteraceae bacterium]
MDNLTVAQRSEIMSRVRGKHTRPEILVRRVVHRMGYRYRLYGSDLPGKPDLVFPGRSKVIFVHGCFWHGHTCRRGRNRPAANISYWIPKLDRNMRRDRANKGRLRRLGWDVLVLWECELTNEERVQERLLSFLGERHE